MNIIVKLQGGLGNQMFQYSFGKYISKKTGRKLIMDTSYLDNKNRGENFVYRDYDLDIFNLDVDVVSEFTEPCQTYQQNFDLIHKVDYLLIERILNSFEKNIYLDGYWPSPSYFDNEIDDFDNFKYPIQENSIELMNRIENSNSIMVNVRRTDYVNNDYHGTYGRDYILKALKKIGNTDNYEVFIFSDDIQWCEENISDLGTIITHEHKGYKFSNYLRLMSLCKWFILPNSSFAWWSAYLSKTKIKVFYPEKFINVPPYKFEEMYPKDWIEIS